MIAVCCSICQIETVNSQLRMLRAAAVANKRTPDLEQFQMPCDLVQL